MIIISTLRGTWSAAEGNDRTFGIAFSVANRSVDDNLIGPTGGHARSLGFCTAARLRWHCRLLHGREGGGGDGGGTGDGTGVSARVSQLVGEVILHQRQH